MNILDGIISFISPKAGYKRESYRQALNETRSNYDAGGYGRVNNNWKAINQNAELTDKFDRDTIRARARDLERNSNMMNSIVLAFKRNVIGKGFTLQAQTDSQELNQELEDAWLEWCKKRNCDVTGTQSLNQMLKMAVVRKRIDGGFLFYKCVNKQNGAMLPFQLQAIEVDELDIGRLQPKYTGNIVVSGIETTAYGKPVGYWFKQESPDGMYLGESKFIEAKDIIAYFTKKRPTQVREISDAAPAVTTIRDTNEFKVAVSIKERILACLSVFIKKQLPISGIGKGNYASPQEKASYDGKTISPGMIKEMNAGDEIQVVNPSGQATDATTYLKLQQCDVGAGQGLSYEAVSRDMSNSTYSSARQSIIEDGDTYGDEIELLLEVLSEIYETFVIYAVLSGVVKIPDFWNRKKQYLKHIWIKSSKAWIDPQKEANANQIALRTGQKTYKEICSERGKDWRQQISDTVEVLEYAKEKGIDMGGVIFSESKEELYEDGENSKK